MEPDIVTARRDPVDLLRHVDDLRHALTERVSHELRTPLTVVLGVAETIHRQADHLSPEQLRQLTSRLQAQGFRLEGLLEDLLDLDRLARSVLAPVREMVDVAALAGTAASDVPLEGRCLELRLGDEVRAAVDVPRVVRIVENLVANVRRHTPPGTHAWLRVGPTEGGVLIEVGDDGPGLDRGLAEEVFEPFVQGTLRHPEAPGMGIGLSLVRRFAELHGGRAWISQPDEGTGTIVRVLLPEREGATVGAVPPQRPRPVLGDGPDLGAIVAAVDPALVGVLDALRTSTGVDVVYLSEFTSTEQVVLATAGDGSGVGIEAGRRIPLEDTFCVPMVEGLIPNAIPDTAAEPRVHRLHSLYPAVAAWCGVPVRLPDGSVFGSLCAAHNDTSRQVDATTTALLASGAALLTHHIAASRGRATEEVERAARIRGVLLRGGVSSVLQPIVELSTGLVRGAEALARFPDARLRPPSAWFADAERAGMSHELERAALVSAAELLSFVPRGGYLSVNASPPLVASRWLDQLTDRLPASRLVIEVTEHAAVEDYSRLRSALESLRDAGARLAVDDVGAGFASFRHVLDLEPDIIKIDRGLVADVGASPGRLALLAGVVSFAERMGATVVAEGLETPAELAAVIDVGVELGQGFLLCRPSTPPIPEHIDLAT